MIIDAHSHLGYDYVFDLDVTEDMLLQNNKAYGIDGGIVQPSLCRPYIKDTEEFHDRISSLCKKNKNYWGMASINPHFTYSDYEKEAERCIKQLGFIGIKLTPIGHACNPASDDGMHVFEVAKLLHVPVMVHTGYGFPFSDPINIIPAAKKFREVKIVIAHAGTNFFTQEALHVAEEYDNVFIEPSGAGIESVSLLLKKLGTKKLMFSTDILLNVPMELAIYKKLLPKQEDFEQVCYRTVTDVFDLK